MSLGTKSGPQGRQWDHLLSCTLDAGSFLKYCDKERFHFRLLLGYLPGVSHRLLPIGTLILSRKYKLTYGAKMFHIQRTGFYIFELS